MSELLSDSEYVRKSKEDIQATILGKYYKVDFFFSDAYIIIHEMSFYILLGSAGKLCQLSADACILCSSSLD